MIFWLKLTSELTMTVICSLTAVPDPYAAKAGIGYTSTTIQFVAFLATLNTRFVHGPLLDHKYANVTTH